MGRITPSKEDYLETLLELSGGDGATPVKSIDVAAELGYSRASISRAMGLLREDGFVSQEHYGQITLTEKGLSQAQAVRRRHDLLQYYLLHILEVDTATAAADACKLEHVVSETTLCRIEAISEKHMREYHGGRR